MPRISKSPSVAPTIVGFKKYPIADQTSGPNFSAQQSAATIPEEFSPRAKAIAIQVVSATSITKVMDQFTPSNFELIQALKYIRLCINQRQTDQFANITLAQLEQKEQDYITQLFTLHVSVTLLVESGIPISKLLKAGCKVSELRKNNIPIAAIRQAKVNAYSLHMGGFSIAQIAVLGIEAHEFKTAKTPAQKLIKHYTPQELNAADYHRDEILRAGYSASELRESTIFTARDIKNILYPFSSVRIYSDNDIIEAQFPIEQLFESDILNSIMTYITAQRTFFAKYFQEEMIRFIENLSKSKVATDNKLEELKKFSKLMQSKTLPDIRFDDDPDL